MGKNKGEKEARTLGSQNKVFLEDKAAA